MAHDPEPTIESIDGASWPEPGEDAGSLVRRVHALRRAPTADLTVEDLRVLVSQRVGLDVVLPIALERVSEDPLAEGDYYPGDLIAALVDVDADYWRAHPAWRTRLVAVVASLDRGRPEFPSATELGERLDEFLAGPV